MRYRHDTNCKPTGMPNRDTGSSTSPVFLAMAAMTMTANVSFTAWEPSPSGLVPAEILTQERQSKGCIDFTPGSSSSQGFLTILPGCRCRRTFVAVAVLHGFTSHALTTPGDTTVRHAIMKVLQTMSVYAPLPDYVGCMPAGTFAH